MESHGDEVFERLLGAAQVGQDWAWERLFTWLGPRVLSYARSQSMPDPEDVWSDVLVDVVKRIGSFSGTESQFRSWVFTIAHSRVVDRRRRMARRQESPLDPTLERAATATFGWADLGELRQLVDRLPEGQRDVLLLRSVLGLSIDEVTTLLNLKPGAVRVSHHRALKALRRSLAVEV